MGNLLIADAPLARLLQLQQVHELHPAVSLDPLLRVARAEQLPAGALAGRMEGVPSVVDWWGDGATGSDGGFRGMTNNDHQGLTGVV